LLISSDNLPINGEGLTVLPIGCKRLNKMGTWELTCIFVGRGSLDSGRIFSRFITSSVFLLQPEVNSNPSFLANIFFLEIMLVKFAEGGDGSSDKPDFIPDATIIGSCTIFILLWSDNLEPQREKSVLFGSKTILN
jgi:hypothetical protein